MAGYAEMGANDNTAGWILTTLDYALGGRMETGIGAKAKATFDNPQAVQALNMLKTMRWTDNSMGSNFDWGWGTSTRRLLPARSACSSAVLTCTPTWCSPTTSIRASMALRRSRWRTTRTPASLGGGTLAAVSPKATPAQIAAAMKWINFYYIRSS